MHKVLAKELCHKWSIAFPIRIPVDEARHLAGFTAFVLPCL